MPYNARRIVTGHNGEGKSILSFAGECTNRREMPGYPGLFVNELWVTNESPAINAGSEDRALRPIQHDPAPFGTIFRIVEFPPESDLTIDIALTTAALGTKHQPSEQDQARHISMHKTDSIDYTVVISGRCMMLLDEEEIEVRQGDCIVQRGTIHGWANRSSEPCVIAFVLIDAVPV